MNPSQRLVLTPLHPSHKTTKPERGIDKEQHEELVKAQMARVRERFPRIYMQLAQHAYHAPHQCVGCDALRRLGR